MRVLGVAVLLLVACGDDDRPGFDGGPNFDGGPMFDAGPPFDGGATFDGGPTVDGGPLPDVGELSPLVDPACTDGMYTEEFPNISAPIDDITFTGDVGAFVDGVLDRRYPIGAALVRGGRMNTSFGMDCDLLFAGSPSTADDVFRRLNTIVHECGHIYDFLLSSTSPDSYFITGDLTLTCSRGDSVERGGDTYARSRLNNDAYSSLRPPCDGGGGRDCDFYGDVYLNGDPDNAEFEGGDQGFSVLFEEAVQYVNSLATEWAFVDRISGSTSARDGILTFLRYIERYLRQARLGVDGYPMAYERITDPCWRDAILTLWGRAWLYLEATEGMPALAINNDALMELVTDPELLAEIEMLRALEGC